MDSNKRDIFIACGIGDLQWLRKCITGISTPVTSLINHEGLTPVHVVARHKYTAMLEYILDHCTDVNVLTQVEGDTPLHCACTDKGSADAIECTKLLLDRQANTNIINKKGQTALHVAAENGNTDIAHLLLLNGANDSVKDVNNRTPLDLSKLNGHYKCTRLLHALHWARQKDVTAMTNLHIQKTLREQMRVQEEVQRKVKEQENKAAYSEWLSSKKMAGVGIPQKCSQRSKDKVKSGKGTCQTCKGTSKKKKKEELHKPAGISRIQISLTQSDHNTDGIGKPDQLYPYCNYPPKQYRKHKTKPGSKASSLSRSASSCGQSSVVRNRRPISVRSMPTPRGMNTGSPVGPPRSYSEYSIHRQDNDIHDQHEDHHGDQDNERTEEIDLEGEGSSSSIDGLTFHEVGPENTLQTLVTDNTREMKSTGSLSAAEILQILRMSSSQDSRTHKLHRRHSTGSGKYSNSSHKQFINNQFNRAISLNAIPEGEVVTSYEETEGSGSRVFDEKLLASLMPYAFNDTKAVSDIEDDKTMEDIDHEVACISTEPTLNNEDKQTLKVVTVAWDEQVHAVKILVEEQMLSPRASPSPRRSPSPCTISPYPSPMSPVPISNKLGTSTLNHKQRRPSEDNKTAAMAALKIKEYAFGHHLNLIHRK